jgi:hypothetical protein
MEGSQFLLPFSESENEDQRSGFPNEDLTKLGSFSGRSCSRLGPHGRAALAIRYASARAAEILATRLQKTATEPAENRSQVAIYSLNTGNLYVNCYSLILKVIQFILTYTKRRLFLFK